MPHQGNGRAELSPYAKHCDSRRLTHAKLRRLADLRAELLQLVDVNFEPRAENDLAHAALRGGGLEEDRLLRTVVPQKG